MAENPFMPASRTLAALVATLATASAVVPTNAPASAAAAQTAIAPRTTTLDSSLTNGVRARMATSTAHTWSVVVNIAGKGRVVDVNGGYGLRPASTEKLFTTLPVLLNQPNRRLTT